MSFDLHAHALEEKTGRRHLLLTLTSPADLAGGPLIVCVAAHSGFGSQWDVFGDQIQTLARRMPWMTVEGNHERDYPDSKDRYSTVYDSGDSGVAAASDVLTPAHGAHAMQLVASQQHAHRNGA